MWEIALASAWDFYDTDYRQKWSTELYINFFNPQISHYLQYRQCNSTTDSTNGDSGALW